MTPKHSPERPERMCENESCEKFGKPTRLMGGCECGGKLVPYKAEDEQICEALWRIASPEMKRLVTYAFFGQHGGGA